MRVSDLSIRQDTKKDQKEESINLKNQEQNLIKIEEDEEKKK